MSAHDIEYETNFILCASTSCKISPLFLPCHSIYMYVYVSPKIRTVPVRELGSQFANWDLFIPVWKLVAQAQTQFANWDRSRNSEYLARMISPFFHSAQPKNGKHHHFWSGRRHVPYCPANWSGFQIRISLFILVSILVVSVRKLRSQFGNWGSVRKLG